MHSSHRLGHHMSLLSQALNRMFQQPVVSWVKVGQSYEIFQVACLCCRSRIMLIRTQQSLDSFPLQCPKRFYVSESSLRRWFFHFSSLSDLLCFDHYHMELELWWHQSLGFQTWCVIMKSFGSSIWLWWPLFQAPWIMLIFLNPLSPFFYLFTAPFFVFCLAGIVLKSGYLFALEVCIRFCLFQCTWITFSQHHYQSYPISEAVAAASAETS